MGQRVIIAVEAIKNDKKIRVAYHHQWGYGTAGASACLGLVASGAVEPKYGEALLDFQKRLENPSNPSLTVYYTDDELRKFVKSDGELDMKELILNHDNNNGAIYLQIWLNKYGQLERGAMRFFRGAEDVMREGQEVGDEMDLRHYFAMFDDEYYAPGFESMFEYLGVQAKWD